MQTRTLARWSFLIGLWTTSASAQTPASAPITVGGDVTLSGSLRTRSYSWDWFGDNGDGRYTYPASLIRLGLTASKRPYEWQVEFAAPVLLNLPTSAVMGSPQGQLGLGASYFAANSNRTNAGYVFLKQGFVRFKEIGGIAGQSLKIGRMEFNDGTEVVPAHSTLAALKRDRISQRLLGNFGFSDVGRSLDGALYSLTRGKLNLTALAARPTRRLSANHEDWRGRSIETARASWGTTRAARSSGSPRGGWLCGCGDR